MKNRMLMVALLCIPGVAAAQNDDQMQRLMEQVRQAQLCMEKIDRGALEAMAKKAEKMEAEIQNLCTAGKRAEAQQRGMKFGQEMAQSAVAKEMRRCSEMMQGAMSGIVPGAGFPTRQELESQHICDAY